MLGRRGVERHERVYCGESMRCVKNAGPKKPITAYLGIEISEELGTKLCNYPADTGSNKVSVVGI